jgi:uncharacterized protein (TIGR03643 family)
MEDEICNYSGLPSLKIYQQEVQPLDTDRIIEMAWEDRTPFEAIEAQFGLSESQVIDLMRKNLKKSSFRRWRAHVSGRKTKHQQLRSDQVKRFKCSRQRSISHNKISKGRK